MKNQSDVSPKADLFARSICLLSAAMLGAISFTAYSSDGHALAYWLSGLGAIVLFAAGTFGPRNLRIGLVGWLPWA